MAFPEGIHAPFEVRANKKKVENACRSKGKKRKIEDTEDDNEILPVEAALAREHPRDLNGLLPSPPPLPGGQSRPAGVLSPEEMLKLHYGKNHDPKLKIWPAAGGGQVLQRHVSSIVPQIPVLPVMGDDETEVKLREELGEVEELVEEPPKKSGKQKKGSKKASAELKDAKKLKEVNADGLSLKEKEDKLLKKKEDKLLKENQGLSDDGISSVLKESNMEEQLPPPPDFEERPATNVNKSPSSPLGYLDPSGTNPDVIPPLIPPPSDLRQDGGGIMESKYHRDIKGDWEKVEKHGQNRFALPLAGLAWWSAAIMTSDAAEKNVLLRKKNGWEMKKSYGHRKYKVAW
ncbi:hypothetical protein F5146DRAFT_1006955 [Armillaria mellea]|nr:hypothetical protein F5146DRAFT_1006955 [Armillaria mellea]